MVRGVLTLVCLLGSACAAAADVWPMNHRTMQIPIRIDPVRRGEIKELLLFVSTDEGRSWRQSAAATPDKESFTFTADADGSHWFALCIVDRQGNRDPADPFRSTPSMRVFIDTVKPVVRLTSAERHGDEIAVAWDIQEKNPDLASLKLEFRTPDQPPLLWTAVPTSPLLKGEARFRPNHAGPIKVRLQLQDQAGNAGQTEKEVGAGTTTVATNPSTGGTHLAAVPLPVRSGSDVSPPPPVAPPTVSPPSVTPTPQAGSPFEQPSTGITRAVVQDPPSLVQPPARGADAGMGNRIRPPAGGRTPENGHQVVAYTPQPDLVNPTPPTVGSGGARPPAASAPGMQITNSAQLSLDYQVDKVGPSGLGSVELWITRNGGERWDKFADHPELKPPMVVNLPGEGVYGLYLVVRSRAGLGRRPPQVGERPQMMLEVDLTAPEAQLYAPRPVPGQRDQLLISWDARDKNLSATPITLEWTERQGGPWQAIGADLPNSGKHAWKLPPNLPYQVYLRLTVRDAAGNAAVAETAQPVLVDLSEPEGVITNVRPVGQGPR